MADCEREGVGVMKGEVKMGLGMEGYKGPVV
jgi:hypothetical protein